MHYITFIFISIALIGFCPQVGFAQGAEEDQEIQGVESSLEKSIPTVPDSPTILPFTISKQKDVIVFDQPLGDSSDPQTVVIQKNYMPKTQRFGFSAGLTLFPSDVFFKTFGAQIRGRYHYSETWGFEASGILLASAKSVELRDLESKQGVTANNLATLNNYFGANLYFSNIYGKYAFADRKIFPFEIYQTLGVGQIATNKSSSPALSLGFGQLLSLSRNQALRVDLSLLLYQTETIASAKQSASSVLVTVSYDSFFPSVGKRW